MLSFQTIQPDTLELLKELSSKTALSGLRLVGGTSLALQYGHRQSIDLDFFGTFSVDMEEILQTAKQCAPCVVINRTNNILQLILKGIKVDFVNYNCYAWIDDTVCESGFILASPIDIAAMKINAIEGRGTKKDFIDIYVLLQHYSLEEILQFYKQKYPEYSEYRALLSLTYFEDADLQDSPVLFIKDTWETMKQAIIHEVKRYQQ